MNELRTRWDKTRLLLLFGTTQEIYALLDTLREKTRRSELRSVKTEAAASN